MDTQRDSDLLEQHITSQAEVAMPDSAGQRTSPEATFEGTGAQASMGVVPGTPAEQTKSEQTNPENAHCCPANAPGAPVQQARTGLQASLRPYSSGKGVPLTMHPGA
eukprot:3385540-Amphidinium_carterae.1